MKDIQVLVVDYGSQYTLVIGRTLRELGTRSVILPPLLASKWLKKNKPKAVILSGSNWSVYSKQVPGFPANLDITGKSYKIFGICYGMQLLSYKLGGKVDKPHTSREYGPAMVTLDNTHPLFKGVRIKSEVWASHGDSVVKLPKGFVSIGTSEGITAMTNKDNSVMGVQFHPEVSDTKEGKKIFKNFLKLSGCVEDWDPLDLVRNIREEVLKIVGEKDQVLLGVSGGVDSTTLAAILAPVLGKRLVCLAIDTGGLRKGELEELKENTKRAGVRNLVVVNAREEFIANISKSIDGEQKRANFRKVYKKIFEQEIKKSGAKYILQGTLATDIIESGQVGGAVMIKTHHNVGLKWKVEDLHPLREFFKYEVRELGKVLGLPKSIYERNPFPGPGLYLRVVGTRVTGEDLDLVRAADQAVRDILKKHKVESKISQLIVALLGIKSVGVKGDERVYGYSLAVRAVETVDFMTAKGYFFEEKIVREITRELTKHKDIVRVFFDVTSKPPATTEFE